MMKKIALATCERFPDLGDDDRCLIPALSRQGFIAEPVIWSHLQSDWTNYAAVIIRSCWDYWAQRDRFLQWTRQLKEKQIPLFNPPEVIHWNTKKDYLQKFHENGIRIAPTEWIRSSTAPPLSQIMDKNGWKEVVIKPMISAGAYLTARVSRADAEKGDQQLQEILSKLQQCEGALIQPFLPEILAEGEFSLIFFSNAFSHAVRKKGSEGEFRVQPQYGAKNTALQPSPDLLDFARKVLALVPETLLYARVDVVISPEGPLLMELELTEPCLFFRDSPGSEDRFAAAFQSKFKII